MSIRFGLGFLALIAVSSGSYGQTSAIPQLNSRPGAAYTVYLNFGGFNFTGNWGGTGGPAPGQTPAYTLDGDAATFNTAEIANIRTVWARTAEKYAAFNVNVTTVDPAPAGSTDFVRQAFYDARPRTMQTVIGGSGSWAGGGGVSYGNVTASSFTTAGFNDGAGRGYHTNFVFAGVGATNLPFIGEAVSHEQGHGLGLVHQSRWVNGQLATEYDTGTGAVAPTMGVAYDAQRGLWRVGATSGNSSPTSQNDVARIRANSGMAGNGTAGFMDSGIGHTAATATVLPMTGTTIDAALARGLIAPNSTAANPIGESNYTTDYFRFAVPAGGATASITLRSGGSLLAPGAADDGATLNATLRLLDAGGGVLFTSDSGVFTETITANNLQAGTYYIQIASAGGTTDSFGYTYFDLGSYFLTGSIVPVPEPAAVLAVAAFGLVAARRRRAPAA